MEYRGRVKDGVIEDPERCKYDPKPLIGTAAGDCGSFTETDVAMMARNFFTGGAITFIDVSSRLSVGDRGLGDRFA